MPNSEPAPDGRFLQRLIVRSFGTQECREAVSPDLQYRLRRLHQSRMDELSRLEFSYFCCHSESFSVFRLLLGIPLLISLVMMSRELLRLRAGRVHCYHILLVSRDGATYAHPFGLGVKFYTGFSDGTCLITAQFAGENYDRPPVTKHYIKASVAEVWEAHRQAIEARESTGARAIRHASFATYAGFSKLEDMAGG